MYSTDNGATIQLRAVTASCNAFYAGALPDTAHAVAVNGLSPVGAAPVTVDVLRQNRRIVQLSPELSRFLTQRVIVVPGGDVCIALLAVNAAKCYQLFHFDAVSV